MPFINDRLDEIRDVQDQERYKNRIARASRFSFDPETAVKLLRERVIGQEQVLDTLDDALHTIKADFSAEHRPLFVILLLGPTGVGKTETVKVIAEAILGDSNRLCRIDMNTLAQEHYSAAITGSPPGYVGSKEGQTLFDVEKIQGSFREPGIVLFDEVEKANRDVVRAIMNIFDSGKLHLTSGVKDIDFRNTIIFMTSNIGVKELAQHKETPKIWRRLMAFFTRKDTDILEKALHSHFDLEFLNRIDHILPYTWLDNSSLKNVISIEIKKLNKRLSKKNAALNITDEAMAYLLAAYDIRFGARDLIRRIRKELEPKLAKALLRHQESQKFCAKVEKGELKIVPCDDEG